jgi:hypothetical protein
VVSNSFHMISWISYTTSKVLPTFVGEEFASSSSTWSQSFDAGTDYRGSSFPAGSYGDSSFYSSDATITISRADGLETIVSRSKRSRISRRQFYTYANNGQRGTSETLTTFTNPLQIVFQETTSVSSYFGYKRSTQTISGYSYWDEDGDTPQIETLQGSIWTTTLINTFSDGQPTEIKSFTQKTTTTMSTVQSIVTGVPMTSLYTTTKDKKEFETYQHPSGDVVVVENTIFEMVPSRGGAFGGYDWKSAVSCESYLTQEVPITDFTYAPTRFTHFFSETYVTTLNVRHSSLSTESKSSVASDFRISGSIIEPRSQEILISPGRTVFPWNSSNGKTTTNYFIPGSQTTLVVTKSEKEDFGHTYSSTLNSKSATVYPPGTGPYPNPIGGGGEGGSTTEGQTLKSGVFYVKNFDHGSGFSYLSGVFLKANSFTAVAANRVYNGIANADLSFNSQNTHSTYGIFMNANPQHTWQERYGFVDAYSISNGIIGLVPIGPTFTGIVSLNAQGEEIAETSKHTTISGSRIGSNFTTTAAYQNSSNGITVKTTESGFFTMQSVSSVHFGVSSDSVNAILLNYGTRVYNYYNQIFGGFTTPNASRTFYISPGVIHSTTYDATNSGTGSTSFVSGTTYATNDVGFVPITMFNLIACIQGYGVVGQDLVDQGQLI